MGMVRPFAGSQKCVSTDYVLVAKGKPRNRTKDKPDNTLTEFMELTSPARTDRHCVALV